MDVLAAAQALNQKAAREEWYQICDPTLAFSDNSYREMLDLWRAKAGDRTMPKRSDMTPRDLKGVLRHLLILERVEQNPSRFRFRLIGTSMTGVAGHHTGRMVDEILPADDSHRLAQCWDLVLNSQQPLRFLGRVHLEGKEYLSAENLYVPLANDNDEPAFVMGLCRYTPRNRDVEATWENQLASLPGGLL
jgi:hypothetical protein